MPGSDLEIKFGDKVDVFDDEHWQKGHVTKDLGNGWFVVFEGLRGGDFISKGGFEDPPQVD